MHFYRTIRFFIRITYYKATTGGGLKITHTTPGGGLNYNEDIYNFVSKNSAFTGAFGLPTNTNYLFISTSNAFAGPPGLLITEGGDFNLETIQKVGTEQLCLPLL